MPDDDPRVRVAQLLPTARQLLCQETKTGTTFMLVTRDGQKAVGRYVGSERILLKRVSSGAHAYRKQPGLGVNLEMVAWMARHARPQPTHLRFVIDRRRHQDVPWKVVCRFAEEAFTDHPLYLIDADVDRQVLLPWEVIEGREAQPHARPVPKPPPLEDVHPALF